MCVESCSEESDKARHKCKVKERSQLVSRKDWCSVRDIRDGSVAKVALQHRDKSQDE